MNLFYVQDSDRPMYVLADNYQQAIEKWINFVALENDTTLEEVDPPLGVTFVCNSEDIITS